MKKRLILGMSAGCLIVMALLLSLRTSPAPVLLSHSSSLPRLIAHRGLSRWAPENTLAAFRQALEEGCDFLEFDVHLTQDFHPVVIHDACVSRTTNYGTACPIGHLSLQQVQTLDAGSWFHPRYITEPVPTLEQVLRLAKGRAGVMVELKDEEVPADQLVAEVARYLDKVGGDIIVGSQQPRIVEELVRQTSYLPIIGITAKSHDLDYFLSLGVQHVALHEGMITQSLIDELSQKGVKVWAWTVDDPRRGKKLAAMGVDGLISNDPTHLFR